MTAQNEIRLYGVSTGAGNTGVSRGFPDFYVRTAEPYLLAAAAAYGCWKPKAWDFLDSELQLGGEAEYTISAWLDGGYESGPAVFVLEVFPVEEGEQREGKMVYAGLEAACDVAAIARAARAL